MTHYKLYTFYYSIYNNFILSNWIKIVNLSVLKKKKKLYNYSMNKSAEYEVFCCLSYITVLICSLILNLFNFNT